MTKKVDFLYVEDNDDYVDFVGRVVKKINHNLHYHSVSDGNDAIEYIESSDSDVAKIILLDVNLPGISGIELLKKIRSIPTLKYTPVIMFSTSDNPQDIKQSYDNGANAYLLKPSGLSPLTEMLKTVCDFWLNLNHQSN